MVKMSTWDNRNADHTAFPVCRTVNIGKSTFPVHFKWYKNDSIIMLLTVHGQIFISTSHRLDEVFIF